MKLPIPFGNPATYKGHTGVDYGQRLGTRIPASGHGRVMRRTYNERAGNAVWVQYDDMPKGAEVGYCHLDNYAESPPPGSEVLEGMVLGRVGNTGFSTGPHLHSEVRGHATTAGYWKYFDPNRIVGQSSPSGGVTAPVPTKRKARSKMSTLFVNIDAAPPTFALAGDGEGEAAWLEFTDQKLANELAGFHGISQKAVELGDVSFREWRDKYTRNAKASNNP